MFLENFGFLSYLCGVIMKTTIQLFIMTLPALVPAVSAYGSSSALSDSVVTHRAHVLRPLEVLGVKNGADDAGREAVTTELMCGVMDWNRQKEWLR